MIDLGLTKMALIGVVALVVIGPEKLPRVARMAGSLFGRAQRYINDVKSEVSREIELDELRQMQREVTEAATNTGKTIAATIGQLDSDIHNAWNDVPSTGATRRQASHAMLTTAAFLVKSKDFRKKRLARNSAVPVWYKHRSGQRSRIVSGAARVAKFRPSATSSRSSFFS